MTAEIKIEKGVPIPVGHCWRHGGMFKLRAALRSMKVGDSFLWDNNRHPYLAAIQTRTRIRTSKESGVGFRVWRVK